MRREYHEKIDSALRAQMIADNNVYIVYDTHDGDYYLVCSVVTNHSMTIDECLNLCGINMDEEADSESWDGWDPDDLIYVSGAYSVKDLIPATSYILRDLDGYGAEHPTCVTREEAERLMRGWYNPDDEPDFDEIWREADENDIAEYGAEED